MLKKFLSLALAVLTALSLIMPVGAATQGHYEAEAAQLKTLGVFIGTDSGFELDRSPTRLEGLIMLVRLLGAEKEALQMAGEPCPFSDVPSFGTGYVNYAYQSGLTKGVGGGLFGSQDAMSAQSYTTFLLRALGYRDDAGDFEYAGALDFAGNIGLYGAADLTELRQEAFLRDHVARTSMLALGATVKQGGETLLEKLTRTGAVSPEAAKGIAPALFAALEVSFIDVGQADAILITKGPYALLIDGGNATDGEAVCAYLERKGITRLDYVVATHPHEDHIGGLARVLSRFAAGAVLMPDAVTTTKVYENLLDTIESKAIPVIIPEAGAQYSLGGASFTIMGPAGDFDDLNNASLVIKLTNGQNSFLFTGDAEAESEKAMVEKHGANLRSDVLKVGHHGSASSTSAAFLKAVSPAYAVISVGAGNDYGHPSQAVLSRLAGLHVYRTDQLGTVVASCNSRTLVFDRLPSPSEKASEGMVIRSVDKVGEVVTIENAGSDPVDLTGWKLVSVTGNQTYVFPSLILEPGQSVTVASGGAQGDLIWTSANIWNNTGIDPAELYDAAGVLVSTLDE